MSSAPGSLSSKVWAASVPAIRFQRGLFAIELAQVLERLVKLVGAQQINVDIVEDVFVIRHRVADF